MRRLMMENEKCGKAALKIILDTDAGSDCDDMLALACLLRAHSEGDAELIALTHCLRTEYGAPALKATARYFGIESIPIGVMDGGAELSDYYVEKLWRRFGNAGDICEYPSAAEVMRRALAGSSGGVTVVAIGQLTNVAALLKSEADGISSLSGVDLVSEKCSRIVLMGGGFLPDDSGKNIPEWNIKWDIEAAKCVFDTARVPIVVLPFETGVSIPSGKRLMEKYGDANPITHAFFSSLKEEKQRPSWDPCTVLYALGLTDDLLAESADGVIGVDELGATYFEPSPNGLHRVLSVKSHPDKTESEIALAIGEFIDCYAEVLIDKFTS